MQPCKKGQKWQFLAQNSHFARFWNLELGLTWTTIEAENAQRVPIFVSTNDIRSKSSKI